MSKQPEKTEKKEYIDENGKKIVEIHHHYHHYEKKDDDDWGCGCLTMIVIAIVIYMLVS